MTIIHKVTKSVETQPWRTENWMGDDWIEVPESLVADAYANAGYCELVIVGGVLASITPTERPTPESVTPVPDPIVQLQEDNKLLRAQLAATIQSNQTLEDCLVEMASVVYA